MASKTANRSSKSTSTSTNNRSFPRGSKTWPLEDAICIGLAQTEAGLPGGDGLSIGDITEVVQTDAVGYEFAGAEANQKIIVNQRLGELRNEGYVRQVSMKGRSRGMPYLLTPKGRRWAEKAVENAEAEVAETAE